MLKCLIIEADLDLVKYTISIAEEIGLTICAIATNFDEIEEALKHNKIDIIIGEIQLGNNQFTYDFFSGRENMPPIIFLSSTDDIIHYKNSQKAKPYIFLKKPIVDVTLRSAIDGALRSKREALDNGGDMHVTDNSFFVRSNGQMINLDPNRVRYIQSEGNYIYIFTKEKKIAIRSSLKNAKSMMGCEDFIQVQRAFMVNVRSLKEITISENKLTVDNVELPIGRKYKKELIQKIKAM